MQLKNQILKLMSNFLKRIFKTKIERTYNYGENPTNDEWKYLSKLKCPDCEQHLFEGPSGGAFTNYLCACGSKFNLAIGLYVGGIKGNKGSGYINFGQRISDSSLKQKT